MSKKQINVSVDISDYDNFQRAYPRMLTRFLSMCIRRALEKKEFFDDVCFSMTYEQMNARFDALKSRSENFIF